MVDLQFLVPLGGFLSAVGGSAVLFFNRADKQREGRESGVIAILREHNETLRRDLERARNESKSRLRAGNKWREQLIENGLHPDPSEWPDLEFEQ